MSLFDMFQPREPQICGVGATPLNEQFTPDHITTLGPNDIFVFGSNLQGRHAGMEAYVKYNRFHLEQRPRYKPNPFHHDNFYYNADQDYYVCPMGQRMTRVGTSHSKTASGYHSENARYQARNCKGCPLRCLCYKAKGDRRTIEVNHRLNQYKRKARELLTSEDGLKHRGRRCIEPEAVFGQMKFNMAYRRFRHFGKDKVTMDFPSLP